MVTSERENPEIDAEQTGIYTVARQYLVDLLDSPDADPRVAEANAIIAILEPLGLPANLRAAVLLYPMARFPAPSIATLATKKLADEELVSPPKVPS